MTSTTDGASRILGTLRAADGKGVVRMEDRYDTDIHDLWSALTEPHRLIRWLGEVEGDLRVGGEFRTHFFSSGWTGAGRVEVCEAPTRLVVRSSSPDEPGEHTIEAVLTADGDQTLLVLEERGMPMHEVAGYGAGIQIHVEDLADHIAGIDRREAGPRWEQLLPYYRALAVDVIR